MRISPTTLTGSLALAAALLLPAAASARAYVSYGGTTRNYGSSQNYRCYYYNAQGECMNYSYMSASSRYYPGYYRQYTNPYVNDYYGDYRYDLQRPIYQTYPANYQGYNYPNYDGSYYDDYNRNLDRQYYYNYNYDCSTSTYPYGYTSSSFNNGYYNNAYYNNDYYPY